MITQHLLLHFPDTDQRRTCQLMLHHLSENNPERAGHWARQLGADLSPSWRRRWIHPRHALSGANLHLSYGTASPDELPLAELRALFHAGLKAAVLQIQDGQAAELTRFHLLDGMKVSARRLAEACPACMASVAALPAPRPVPNAAEPIQSAARGAGKAHRPATATVAAATVSTASAADAEAAAMAYVRRQRGWPG
jgi:hypothetical protein